MWSLHVCQLWVICARLFMYSEVSGNYTKTELSSDFKQLLSNVKPGFEEYLVRAFKNEAVRNEQRNVKHYIHEMDNVLISAGDTKIELGNLKFPWIPDFRIISISADFPMLCLDVNFKLGDLRVEGDYEANNLTLQKLLPVSNNGKIEVTFIEVICKGRIGLLIKGDSFVPQNYDVKYEPAETAISVKYFVSNKNQIENKIIKQNDENIVGDSIWLQLNEILSHLLHLQLAEVVVELSVTEFLADEDEQLRELAREHSQRANKLLDSLLCTSKDYLVEKNYRSIETPSFNVVYKGKPSGLYQGKLQTGVGYIQDLSTLSRLEDLSLYEDKQKVVVYGSLTLREFKHGYEHYTSEFEGTQIAGSIKTTVYKNTIFIKITVLKEGERCKTQLDTLRVSSVGDIDTDASGMASLIWLGSKLEKWVVGNLRYSGLPALEKQITEAFNYAIGKTDCVSLLVD